MITLYLHANQNEITYNKKNYLLLAAKRMGLENIVKDVSELNGQVPDYVLNIEPYGKLVTGKKWTGVWEIDIMFDRQEMSLSDWIASDTVFIANPFIPERMNAYQGNKIVLFQASDPELHRRIPSIPQEFDFVFSGTNGLDIYRERERIMQLLKENNFTFHDFGKDHPPHTYIEFLNHARVQFIRSATKLPIGDSQIEQRFFECLAIGPVLKDYHPALETIGLEEGKDFYWYKNDEEMLEKMHYLIDNPDFAKKMASNGRNKVLMYHCYEHRLFSILKYAEEHAHG